MASDGASHLHVEEWPECIPPTEPTRKYGPQAWWQPAHDDPHGVDAYQHTHPTAASLGERYLGDVCPFCGVPLRWDAVVYNVHGERGELIDVSPNDDPVPCYHRECWHEREAAIDSQENTTLDAYAGGQP